VTQLDDKITAEWHPSTTDLGAQPPQPFSSLVRLDFGAVTHVGKVRTNNEDAYIIYRNSRAWERLFTSLPPEALPERHDETAYVMAVADGMGGLAGGEVASRLSIRTGIYLVLHAVKWTMKLDHPEERDKEIDEGISRAASYFDKINQALIDEGRRHPDLAGMGTTLTVSFSVGDDLLLFHIGDCRAYLWREGRLRQLTRDHTMAQSLADAGIIPVSQLPKHRLRHMLTKALGTERGHVHTEVHQLQIADGDRLLLCSDGLYDMVTDEDIAAILSREVSSQRACQALVDQALANGGKDNVTVLLARYGIPPRPEEGK
jgi:serine/threonine protein phosphatase PrpC